MAQFEVPAFVQPVFFNRENFILDRQYAAKGRMAHDRQVAVDAAIDLFAFRRDDDGFLYFEIAGFLDPELRQVEMDDLSRMRPRGEQG